MDDDGHGRMPEEPSSVGDYSLFTTFYFMARTCSMRLGTAEEEVRKQRAYEQQNRLSDPRWDEGVPLEEQLDREPAARVERLAISRLLFSALTLESFINYYGFTKLGEIFPALDRLPTPKKWLTFPQIAVSRSLSPELMAQITEVFKLRDDLAHNKTVIVDYANRGARWDLGASAKRLRADLTVERAVTGLNAIDNSVEIEWATRKILSEWSLHW